MTEDMIKERKVCRVREENEQTGEGDEKVVLEAMALPCKTLESRSFMPTFFSWLYTLEK